MTWAPVPIAAFISRSCGLPAMGAVWSALLVGGGLAGALFIWLMRDTGKKRDAKQEEDASLGEAVAAGGDQDGSGGLSPGPTRRELITKPGILPPRVSRADGLQVHRGGESHLEPS